MALILFGFIMTKRQGVESFKPFFVVMMLASLLLFSVPFVSISLCIMLGGFYLQRRVWVMIGSLSMLYFVGHFYYDLDTTLDAKALYLALLGLGVILIRYQIKGIFSERTLSNKEVV